MTVKALKRQLMAAIAMVLVATIALGSSTYAWFAANVNVDATGMTVVAKSDNTFLVINEGSTFDATNEDISVTSTHANVQLYPSAPTTTITSANVETATSWHYAYSDDPADSTKVYGYYDIDAADLGDYLVSETFSIGLNQKSGATTANNLKLASIDLPDGTGISAVVVCGTNAYTYTADATSNAALAATVTTSGVVVTVYYFINGEDTNVTTNNIANLTGAVELHFAVDG